MKNSISFLDNVVDVGSSLVEQVFLRSDVNCLHGPNLSGQKQARQKSRSLCILIEIFLVKIDGLVQFQ
jgi:hypothetical protein